jgi:hypothetical protein
MFLPLLPVSPRQHHATHQCSRFISYRSPALHDVTIWYRRQITHLKLFNESTEYTGGAKITQHSMHNNKHAVSHDFCAILYIFSPIGETPTVIPHPTPSQESTVGIWEQLKYKMHETKSCGIILSVTHAFAARPKAWVCGRSPADVGPNPTGGGDMDFCLLWV